MGVIGLDYVAIELVVRTLGLELTPLLLKKIQVAERIELERANKE